MLKRVDAGDLSVAYEDNGSADGVPVMLLHGFPYDIRAYDEVTPLLVSTDYSFRSQDAIGWNPRHFHFASDEASFGKILKTFNEYENKTAGAQEALATLVSHTPEGTLTILDAHLIPGISDQVPAASTVVTHFTSTAHTVERSTDGKTTPLGRLNWMRFRISLEIPADFRLDPSLVITRHMCKKPAK